MKYKTNINVKNINIWEYIIIMYMYKHKKQTKNYMVAFRLQNIYLHISSSYLAVILYHTYCTWFSIDRKLLFVLCLARIQGNLEFLTNPCDIWPADLVVCKCLKSCAFQFFSCSDGHVWETELSSVQCASPEGGVCGVTLGKK